ncbi:MAG: PAS domain S-box protein [Chloroflexota bacterium]
MLKPTLPTVEVSLNSLKAFFAEQKRAETNYLDREKFAEYFSSVMQMISDGLFVVNLQGDVIYMNDEMQSMWELDVENRYSPDNFPKVINKIISPESFMARVVEIYKNIEDESYDRIERVDKQIFDRRSKPLIFKGQIIGRIWIYKNVTEQLEVFQILEESKRKYEAFERRFQRVFDLAPIGMSLNRLDGTFLKVNRSFEKLVGYSEHELLSKKFAEITHPDDLDNNLDWLHRLRSREIVSYQIEKRYIRKNGSIANVFLQVTLVFDTQKSPVYIIGQIVDMSNLKSAEQALFQKQKMESIGILAGGIAHDFNNLLVALTAQSEIALAKLETNNPAVKHINKAILAAESGTLLINQLLAYSGRGRFEILPLNLNDIINQQIDILEVAIPKNVTIKRDLLDNLPNINADPSQMQQIIMNLTINGAEAIEQKAGEILIKTDTNTFKRGDFDKLSFVIPPPAPGKFIVFSVKDNGKGMSKETIQKIFDPFFSTKFKGRGLGLAAVSGIARSHNCGLVVNSFLNVGTEFQLYFPVSTQQDVLNDDLNDGINNNQSMEKQKGMTRKQILLIDDDPMVRSAIEDIFELEKIDVICAPDGASGIQNFNEYHENVGLILLDLSMPGLSSQEVFIALKEIERDIPIILLSGHSEFEIGDKFTGLAYEAFVQKPFKIEQMLEIALSYLD